MTRRFVLSLFLLTFAASSVVAQVTAPPVRASDAAIERLLIKKVNPIYPPLARQARIQGTVVLQVFISKDGDVENIQLISGHPLLAPSAVAAVKQWKCRPYLLNGEAVEVQTSVRVNFRMSDKPPEGVARDHPGGFPPDSVGSNPDSSTEKHDATATISQFLSERVQPIYPPVGDPNSHPGHCCS